MYRNLFALLVFAPLLAAQARLVRVEEPTGIYMRRGEVIRVPGVKGPVFLAGSGCNAWGQQDGADLLFPVTVRPGQPLMCRLTSDGPAAPPARPLVRRVGMGRIELEAERFRAVIDLERAAITEVYPLRAAAQRGLNLVETTPETKDRNDIHEAPEALRKPVSPVTGAPNGWTSLAGQGRFTGVEVHANGPHLARVRLAREGGAWELEFPASGAWVRWRAPGGFRLASISATPFMPFTRCLDGNEKNWPSGPETSEPPGASIGVRNWTQPPGRHFVYYRHDLDYGALGVLDPAGTMQFAGACTPKLEAKGGGELVLTFPAWRGNETVLAARESARQVLQPVLVRLEDEPAAPLPPEPAAGYAAPAELDLSGEWELAWGEKGRGPTSEWRKVSVPGSAHVQWLGREAAYTRAAEWVSEKEWWYRRSVRIPDDWKGRRVRLEFGATDYYAEVFLDGRRVAAHEGYIDPHGHDIAVRAGATHALQVRVWTPVSYYWRHRPYTIKGSYGAVDQKPDNITPLGITRGVRMRALTGPRIADVGLATWLREPGADVEIHYEVEGEGRLEAVLAPRGFAGETARGTAPGGRGILTLHLDKPALWWTWDRGTPHLYDLDLRLLDRSGRVLDTWRHAVGIREIEYTRGRFYLNRQPLFLRGTNTYYNLFLSEMDRAAHQRDLKLMREMNVNTVRLHCHFENPEFYDLADEMGLLLWQDFLEAWYPHDPEFSPHAAKLYDNHMRYVRNHPSVAVWAVSDEESFPNYVDLSKHLAARAALLDPQRRWVVRSTGRYDDAHLYHGWYGGSIWNYARMNENLVTEFGATSLPNAESLEKFLGGKWPIEQFADDWVFRKLQIEEARKAWGRQPGETPAQVAERSQRYAARIFQLGLERARRRKAEGASGVFHFFAIDIWPSVTMSAIDFYRQPKREFYQTQRSFQPVLASIEFSRDRFPAGQPVKLPLWAINDRLETIAGELRWRCLDAAGTEKARGSTVVSLPPDSSQPAGAAVFTAAAPGAYRLVAEIWQGSAKLSENVFEFDVTGR